ncbi:MAG TPA: M48 family metalloprotease [Gemmatimonadota bacterium]|nr:M48 family metalloprotease [Gemmatimonadota bacterium]
MTIDAIRRQVAAGLGAAVMAGCATNPATGERELSLIGEQQEISMGRQADRDVQATIGVYEDPALQAYIEGVGTSLAQASERPELPWTFRVADDPAVNAFALPGGFVYVTRGLLATMNSEAELAAVLGHEIGHVTARHAVNRISRAQLTGLGLGIGMILSPELAQFGDLASLGLNLLFLKYSRDDERESDELGLRYMLRVGYDPDAMVDVFAQLERASGLSESERVPDWLATHPGPEERGQRAADALAALAPAEREGTIAREAYQRQLDGLVYGQDPRQGFFRNNELIHPELRFRMKFPDGWRAVNQRQQVLALSPQEDALEVLTFSEAQSADAAARAFAASSAVRTSGFTRGTSNGLAVRVAEFEALAQDNSVLAGLVMFVEHGGRVYQVIGYGPRSRWRSSADAVERSLSTFRPLTDPALLAERPDRIDLVTLASAMTLEQYVGRYPSTIPVEQVALINAVSPGTQLEAGRIMKRVVEGR